MSNVSSWMPNLLGPLDVQVEGVDVDIPRRSTFNFVGLTVEDEPEFGRTKITGASNDLASATGVLGIAHGGTGQTALGNSYQVWRTNYGITAGEWATIDLTSAPSTMAGILPRSRGGTGVAGGPEFAPVVLEEFGTGIALESGTSFAAVATVGGITITLPASPANGETFEVYNIAGTSITVNGGGHNINGASTDSLAQYESAVYRFAGTSSVWVKR